MKYPDLLPEPSAALFCDSLECWKGREQSNLRALGPPPGGGVVLLGWGEAAMNLNPSPQRCLTDLSHTRCTLPAEMAQENSRQKPPYTAVKDLETFFSKMPTSAAPAKVDTKWVTAKKMATVQPAGIPTLLRWLGVIDKDGKPDVDVLESPEDSKNPARNARRAAQGLLLGRFFSVRPVGGDPRSHR